jgi:NodT family efflux transporter outer membrane factor (OMF) lipoprotein
MALGALLVAACVSPAGIQSTASMQSASQLATSRSLLAQGGQWPTLDWPTQIGGVALQKLVDEALADNPGLQAAATRLDAAAALADATRAAAGPTIGAGFSSTYQRYTENGIIPPPLAGKRKSDNQLLLNFAYDFDFWGRHAAELRAVLAQGKVLEAEHYNARLMLATAIARSFVQLQRQFGQLDLVERQLTLRASANALTTRRIAAGLDPQGDLEGGTQQLESLRAEQSQWQQAIALSRNQLAALLGKGPDRGLSIARPAPAQMVASALPDNLPLELLGRRPDIVAARWRIEASQGAIDTARVQFYPNINLGAFVGLSSLGLSNLLKAGSLAAGIGPAIRLPIFEGGALRANLTGRVADYDGAVDTYNQALIEALHDVADQVASVRSANVQTDHQHKASLAAAKTAKLSAQRQRVGTVNRLQVIAAEAALAQQQRIELDTQLRATEARLGLIKALGGGFDAGASGLAAPMRSAGIPKTAISNTAISNTATPASVIPTIVTPASATPTFPSSPTKAAL